MVFRFGIFQGDGFAGMIQGAAQQPFDAAPHRGFFFALQAGQQMFAPPIGHRPVAEQQFPVRVRGKIVLDSRIDALNAERHFSFAAIFSALLEPVLLLVYCGLIL